MEKISIIIPCYNEGEVIKDFNTEICKVAKKVKADFEFIYINDGSKDNTLELVKAIAKKDERVKYISFSRNFGKEAGIYAGLKNATGDYVVIIDADLQHDPYLIVDMYDYVKGGYDSVAVRRVDRKGEKKIRSFFSETFYKLMKKITNIEIIEGEMDYRMMSRDMYQAVLRLSEYNRFSKGLFSWVGFDTKWIEQPNIERTKGETKWSFKALVAYSLNGITSFSTVPLLIPFIIGVILLAFAFLLFVIMIIEGIVGNVNILTSINFSIFLTSGLISMSIGVLCEYLSKMYTEVQKRPIYIEKESNIKNEKNKKSL